MNDLLTEKQYQEADIWLAEQMGECVHDWEGKHWHSATSGDHHDWYCKNCPKIVQDYQFETPPSTIDTPRSKDLSAMVDVADKLVLNFTMTPLRTTIQYTGHVEIRYSFAIGLTMKRGKVTEYYKDHHESPQRAAACAIYLALREVKK